MVVEKLELKIFYPEHLENTLGIMINSFMVSKNQKPSQNHKSTRN